MRQTSGPVTTTAAALRLLRVLFVLFMVMAAVVIACYPTTIQAARAPTAQLVSLVWVLLRVALGNVPPELYAMF